MSIEFLRRLSAQTLPATITVPDEVDQVRTLRATDSVAAMLSPPGSHVPFARVLAITKEGRALLALGARRERSAS